MTNVDREQRALDIAFEGENEGSILQFVGWTLLGFDSIPVVWVPVGWRSGSWFWFWLVFGLACLGAALLVAGERRSQRAARDLAAAAEAIRGCTLSPQGQEQPRSEGMEPRAA